MWTLVFILITTSALGADTRAPVVVPGFSQKSDCMMASANLEKALKSSNNYAYSTCVEVK